MLQPVHSVKVAVSRPCPIEFGCQILIENFIDQRGFAGTGDTRNTGECAQRNLHLNVFQIVFPCATNGEAISVSRPALFRQRNLPATAKILPRNRLFAGKQPLHITGVDHISP